MKNVRGVLAGLFVLALLAIIPAAFAQEDTLGLSADDYALWMAANAESTAQTSFNYEFTFNIAAAGTDEASAFAGEITGMGAVGNGGFSMTTDGALQIGEQTIPTPLSVIQAGDSLYLNLGGTWYGGTLDEITEMGGGLAGALPVDPNALAGDPALMNAAAGLGSLQPGDFLSASRLADTADGFAVIELNIGIEDLLASDAIAPLLGTAVMGGMGGGMGAASPTPDPAQAAMAAQMMGSLFADATFTLTQTIDPATSLVQNTVLAFSLPLSQLMMMAGQQAPADAAITLDFDITLSSYGAADAVEAPAEFQPFSELMQGLGGMMGGMSG